MRTQSHQEGFTLIELLVVISIIGVLASVVLASVSQAKVRAQNTATLQQVRQIQLALELYYQDHGEYPDTSDFNYGPSNNGYDTEGLVCATKPGCVFDGVIINNTLSTYLAGYIQSPKLAEQNEDIKFSLKDFILPTAHAQGSVSFSSSDEPIFYQCQANPCLGGNTRIHYAKVATVNSAPEIYSRLADSSVDLAGSISNSSSSSGSSSSDSSLAGDSSDNLGGGDSGSSDGGSDSDSGDYSDSGDGSDYGGSSDSGYSSDSGESSDSGSGDSGWSDYSSS